MGLSLVAAAEEATAACAAAAVPTFLRCLRLTPAVTGAGAGAGAAAPTGRSGRRACADDGASATGTDTSDGSEASMAALEGPGEVGRRGEEKSAAAAEGGGKLRG